jgi:hypothetical protein
MTIWRMRIACWIPKGTNRHTLRLRNTNSFYTATVVTRTCLFVTFYLHRLSCYLLSRRLVGPQIRSGKEKKKSFFFLGSSHDSSIVQPATYSPYRLSYPSLPQHPNKNVRSVVLLDYKRTWCSCDMKITIWEPDWVATVVILQFTISVSNRCDLFYIFISYIFSHPTCFGPS